MRALQSFHHEAPVNFGAWFRVVLADRPLPWSWDQEDAAMLLKWFSHFGWYRHLGEEDPTNSAAASVMAEDTGQVDRAKVEEPEEGNSEKERQILKNLVQKMQLMRSETPACDGTGSGHGEK